MNISDIIKREFGIDKEDLINIVSGYRFLFDSETDGHIEVSFYDNGCQLVTSIKGDFAWDVIEVYKAFSSRFND